MGSQIIWLLLEKRVHFVSIPRLFTLAHEFVLGSPSDLCMSCGPVMTVFLAMRGRGFLDTLAQTPFPMSSLTWWDCYPGHPRSHIFVGREVEHFRWREGASTWCQLYIRKQEDRDLMLFNLGRVIITPGSWFCLHWELRILRISN